MGLLLVWWCRKITVKTAVVTVTLYCLNWSEWKDEDYNKWNGNNCPRGHNDPESG